MAPYSQEQIEQQLAELASFDPAFQAFLDDHPYSQAEYVLLSAVYHAFQAGWEAAGGSSVYRTEMEKYEYLHQLKHRTDIADT